MKLNTSPNKSVYLDVCSLCRSFDDQRFMRIRLETLAVELIMERIKIGDYHCWYSPVHLFEIEAFNDPFESGEVRDFLLTWGTYTEKNVSQQETRMRAEKLYNTGFGQADAAHVAIAESVNAPFITCDDKLIKLCRKNDCTIWCGTPVEFCEKEHLK